MQDNNTNTDKAFTDRSWKEMKSLLDQEMPTADSKKRRPIFIWLTGAVGIAAVFLGIYFFTNIYDIDAKNNSADKIIIAENNSLNNREITNKNEALIEETHSEKIQNKIPPTFSAKNKRKSNPTESQTFETKINSNNYYQENIEQEINENQKPSLAKESILPITMNVQNIEFNDNVLLIPNPEITANENPNSNNDILANIALNKLVMPPFKKLEFTPEIKPVFLAGKKPKTIRHTAFASTSFSYNSKTNGLNFGYLRNVKSLKNGLTFQAGIAYNYIAQPIEYTFTEVIYSGGSTTGPPESSDVLFDIGYSSSNNSRLLSNNGATQTYLPFQSNDIPINRLKLHYLSVPLLANLEKGRFRIIGGLQGGLLLFAKNSSFNGGVLKNLGSNKTADFASANDPLVESNVPQAPKVANFDFSVILGAGYKLSDNVGLQISSNYGIKDVIKQNTKKDYNRALQLTMLYSW